jgi:hypothetical protein
MTPIEEQFEILKAAGWPSATLVRQPDGSHIVSVKDLSLPPGWSKANSSVHFLAPVGYPLSRPDCFWADADLRLANASMPQNTGVTPVGNTGVPGLWFSYHVSAWNPNNDNLLTYLHVIKGRFKDLR